MMNCGRFHAFVVSLLLMPAVVLSVAYSAAAEEVRVVVDATSVVNTMRGGMGASWHAIIQPLPDRGNGFGGNPPPEDNTAWQQLYRHAEWLGMDWVRVEFTQRMYEPQRNRFEWDNPEMKTLWRILDWCESRNVDVLLQQMRSEVAWNTFPEWRDDAVRISHSGPLSMDDFANGLATFTQHLLKKKDYTCIRWLCITCQPGSDWSWWQKPPNEQMPLKPGLEAVRKALDAKGLAVPLAAPDWMPPPTLSPEKIDFDHVAGAYDLNSLSARFDWHESKDGIPMVVIQKRLADWSSWAHKREKPCFLGELGTVLYGTKIGDPGPGTYEAALQNAELVIRGMNAGIDGFSRWSFVNRAETGPQWQLVDTYDVKGKRFLKCFAPHPNSYYLYGLLSRFTAKHSAVLCCNIKGGTLKGHQRVFAAMLRSPKGNLTLAVINDAPSEWDAVFEINGLQNATRLLRYRVSQADRDRADLTIKHEADFPLSKDTAVFGDRIPAASLTIYTTYNLTHSASGIIAE